MKAKKRGLSFIDKLFVFINILLSAALLLSYLAPSTDPATYWEIAFFGLAYPFLLLANTIMVIYWLLRRSIWILLPVICIAIGWDALNKTIGFRSEPASYSLTADNIRVMTYNVHDFKRYGSKNDISTKHEILQIITDEHPDIIGFQEFYSRKHGQYDMVDSIKRIIGASGYYFLEVQSNNDEAIGMAIFSKFPVIAHGMVQLNDLANENQCVYIDVKKGAQTFRFYSVHLQSIHFGQEDYRYLSKVSARGKPNVDATKRVGSKLKTAFIKRSIQVLKIKESASTCPYPYIISGDFNDTPLSYAVNQMSNGLKNAFCEKGSGIGRTYNGDFPNYQIDYIMPGKQFNVLSYHIIEKKLSDHYPVRSDLLLK
jgi:endonuclease/exonuclease/phosphatase family metal-dependent hydrolase